MFPGRRGAGRIFYNQVRLSGAMPQICLLFGPSAAGGAYIPAFCDVVFMVDGNAWMYLGSPRMAEMVIGEKVTLEEMGGARMHCEVSGCGDLLAKDEEDCIAAARDYLGYLPQRSGETPPAADAARRRAPRPSGSTTIMPANQNQAFDIAAVIDALVDEGSFFEIKKLFAREIVTGFARLDGRAGRHRRQPAQVEGRRALRRLAPTRRRASSGSATRSTCRCSSWPTCRAS